MCADELVLGLRLVHRDTPARDDAQAVSRLEFEISKRRPKDDAANLRRRVLQREVQMTGVPQAAVRQLPFDPDLEELAFEQIADADRELGDREHAARRHRCRRPFRFRLRLLVFKRQIEQIRHRSGSRNPRHSGSRARCASRAPFSRRLPGSPHSIAGWPSPFRSGPAGR